MNSACSGTRHICDERSSCPMAKSLGGFTLVELLLALSIFAVLSVMAYGGLNYVLNSSEYSEKSAARLGHLQVVYGMMSRDLEQVVDRGIRDEYGGEVHALLGSSGLESHLEFTRGGWRNPAGRQRSELQRVAYGMREDALIRRSWLVLDRAQDSKPREQVLLDGLENLEVRYLNDAHVWMNQWPEVNVEEYRLPRAVEITLRLKDMGPVTWLFRLPDAGTYEPG